MSRWEGEAASELIIVTSTTPKYFQWRVIQRRADVFDQEEGEEEEEEGVLVDI